MEMAFNESIVLSAETNIELFKQLNDFSTRMEEHIEKFPNYRYYIELLGGKPGEYKAMVTIIRYDNKKTELAKGDSSSHGVL